MPLSNSSFYDFFRYNNYDFENLFKTYRELGDNVVENFRQTEKNLFVKTLGTYRIVPRQFLNISGAQYNAQSIKSILSSKDAKRFENRFNEVMPSAQNQKYYNTWDMSSSDVGLFEFTENGNGECYISKYVGKSISDIVIPFKSPSGSLVTGITDAFANNPMIRRVVIPSSVVWIDKGAFKGCTRLNNVEFSYGIQAIGVDAFSGCTSLSKVDLPNSILEIGDRAFKGCKRMQKLSLSDNLRTLGIECFAYCEALADVLIPDTVQVIGDYSFYGCKSLKEINTPLITSIIGEGAFKNCSSLTYVYLHENLSEIKISAFEGCASLKEVFIPKSVTKICDSAFAFCLNLENVTFEITDEDTENLTIGDNVFSSAKVTSVHFPDRTSNMGKYILQDNNSLKYVRLPDNENISTIPEGTFLNCRNLVSINIPENISGLKRLSFAGCTGLNTIFLNTTEDILCFDANECRNVITINLVAEYPELSEEEIAEISSIAISDGKINFSGILKEFQEAIQNNDEYYRLIWESVINAVDSQAAIDKDLFRSTSPCTDIYSHQSTNSYNEIQAYNDFYNEYNNAYIYSISYKISTQEDFGDVWIVENHANWGSPTDGYYVRQTKNEDTNTLEEAYTISFNSLIETPATEFVKPIFNVYIDSYPLNRNAYSSGEIMSNDELCAVLDTTGNYIELFATMGREAINENPTIVSFELYDKDGSFMVEGVDYMLINNRFYLIGDYADSYLYSSDLPCEMRNIAIDFDTVNNKIGNNLNIEYTNKLSKTEFCEATREYTLRALLGPRVSAMYSAAVSYDEIFEEIQVFDRINTDPGSLIREAMDRNNLTPYDFVVYCSENINYNRLMLYVDYAKMVKPPETNFMILCYGVHEEVYDGAMDSIADKHHEVYDEDYANRRQVGKILHLNNTMETTNTVSYVTYHTSDAIDEETIKEDLYTDALTDNLYIISNGERTPLTVIHSNEETLLNIGGEDES